MILLMPQILEEKRLLRIPLTRFSYPEKVRLVEKMRHAAHEIHSKVDNLMLRENCFLPPFSSLLSNSW